MTLKSKRKSYKENKRSTGMLSENFILLQFYDNMFELMYLNFSELRAPEGASC